MTKFRSASLALIATLCIGCERVDTAEPRALTGAAADQAPRASQNTSPVKKAVPPPPLTQTETGSNAQGAATLEFKKRIDAYIKIHNSADAKVPSLKKTD